MKRRCQKILIVDDDPMLAKTLADILRFKQYDARVAHSALSALQVLGLAGELNTVDLRETVRAERVEASVNRPFDTLRANGERLKSTTLAGELDRSQTAFIPDYIISDVKMPGMNGVELFRKLQQYLPELPMILMTAYTEEQLLQEGLAEGVLEVLTKPLSIPHLLTILAGG